MDSTASVREILVVSLNHRVTPLEVREDLVFSRDAAEDFLKQVEERLQVPEAMMISTCNRTEIFIAYEPSPEKEHGRRLIDLLCATRGFVATERPRNYAVFRNEEAARHLFRVAAGLDSQILGESQILGQVKNSLAWGQAAGTNGRVLHRLWERSLRVGKRVRTETAIGEGALSASYAALGLARKIFGRLASKRVLVVGTGEIGVLALESLHRADLASLTIMNRTRSRAEDLAKRFGGEVRDFVELPEALAEADFVISSTSSRQPLIRYEEMKRIRHRRGGNRPLLIIDLALPRDFEESCGGLDEVFLKNLDDLSEIVQANIAERRTEMPRAEAIIDGELSTFLKWLQTFEVEPTIRKLRELFHAIRLEELDSLRNVLDEESFQRLELLTYRLVNRLLHLPTENLRRHPGLSDRDFISAVHELLTEEIPHPKELEKEQPTPRAKNAPERGTP